MGLAPPAPAPAGRGAAIGVRRTPEGSPPAGLPVAGAWVLHMPAVGLVVDDRGRMKQTVLTYLSSHVPNAIDVADVVVRDVRFFAGANAVEDVLDMGLRVLPWNRQRVNSPHVDR